MPLECRSISYTYPGSESAVIRDISFAWKKPGFHALFGPSGVGKTTFAGIIAGHVSEYSGEIITHDIKKIAYTDNQERLPGWSAVGRHLFDITPAHRKSLLDELIDIFGVGKCMNRRFPQLSLGQKNRVNLIRYLLQDFQFLILDESLANVDEGRREKIILHIKERFPEIFFLYISHNVSEVARLCDDILIFQGLGSHSRVRHIKGGNRIKNEDTDRKHLNRMMLEMMNVSAADSVK